MRRIQVGLPDDILDMVDEARGPVARERFLRDLITERVQPTSKPIDTPESVEAKMKQARRIVDQIPGAENAKKRAAGNTGVAGGTKGASPVPAKGCRHSNARRKFGKLICPDCGAVLS